MNRDVSKQFRLNANIVIPDQPTLYIATDKDEYADTVDSRYLEFQGTLLNNSRYPYLDI